MIKIIIENLDEGSYLIIGLTCKELYKILKKLNSNKLIASLEYITTSINLLKYAHNIGCPWNEEFK